MLGIIRKQSIKAKLMLIIMLTSIVCLLLTGAAVVVYERYHVTRDLVSDMNALAMLIADRSTAALTFQDPRLAEENLAALHVKPAVVAACILNENGDVFARYNTIDASEFDLAAGGKKQGHRFIHDHLLHYAPIFLGGKEIGTVCIYADLKGFYRQRSYFMLLVAMVILFSSLIALYLSSRLQLLVSRPLRQLTETTQSIAAKKNYALRAEKSSDDEIGILVDAFNGMLETIDAQNQEREKLNAELEERVAKRTTQLEAANRELEAFSYSVSHDLRAPLRHASGFVDLLLKRCQADLSEKGRHYLDAIADSVRQMGVLIDDLLQFSRTGRTELRLRDTNMNEVLADVRASLRQDNPGREIEWIVGDMPRVFGDEAMLKLVWMNLLSNAVKFTRTRKKAMIEVGVRPEGGEHVFFVRDNGVGFDMQYAHKLFGVFQRLHSLDEFEGTGIGLANVRRIVLRHEGRTWAESELDKGTTIYFTLPIRKEVKP
ncbi:MAG: ATP-binding protein [Acidobacteriota bacterium]|jgi:signal transduction histidine kinase|nr:ATP-binding protein [Acidobacteriota bacterium]